MRWTLLMLVVAMGSCFSRAANERYGLRVREIDRQHGEAVDEIEFAYATAYDRIMKVQREALIPTASKNKTEPRDSVAESAELKTLETECLRISQGLRELQSLGANTNPAELLLKQCIDGWNNTHARLLITTYWAADVDWVLQTIKLDPDTIKIESLFVYSHNLRLKSYVEKQLAELNAARVAAKRELEDQRQFGIQQAAIDRDDEIAANKRRFAAALATVAQSMSNTQQSAYQQPSYGAAYGSASSGCTSDFSCGIGYRCVKANFSGTGYCAKAVNEYGVQTFDLPDMNSVFVKMPENSDCKFVTDCPAGLTCDTRSGVCVR